MNQTTSVKPRLDYSELVITLLNGENRKADKLMEELIPKLEDYLKVVMGSDESTAKECAQQAFLNVYEHIMQDKIKVPKYVLSYLLKACRNEYIRFRKNENRFAYDEDVSSHMVQPAEQIDRLIDDERKQVLENCLKELDEESREFITYFMKYPDATTKQACKHFNLTSANVRTKKSRLIKQLHESYKKKAAL